MNLFLGATASLQTPWPPYGVCNPENQSYSEVADVMAYSEVAGPMPSLQARLQVLWLPCSKPAGTMDSLQAYSKQWPHYSEVVIEMALLKARLQALWPPYSNVRDTRASLQ